MLTVISNAGHIFIVFLNTVHSHTRPHITHYSPINIHTNHILITYPAYMIWILVDYVPQNVCNDDYAFPAAKTYDGEGYSLASLWQATEFDHL